MSSSSMTLLAFSALLAVVEAKAKEAEAPPAETPAWMIFAAAAVVGLAGSIACKSNGLAAPATALGACFAFAFLELVSEAVAKPYLGFPIVAGGHAAVTCILFAMPKAPMLATATKVIGGHILATIASIAQLALVPADLSALSKVIAVSLAIGAMKSADAVHPPAVSFAFLFVTGGKTYDFAIGPIIGCAVLIAAQELYTMAVGDAKQKTK